MWHLMKTLIVKELLAVLRDPQSRALLIGPVLLQLLLFPWAATLEVKHATIAVLDRDGGAQAIEVIQRVALASAFDHVLRLHGEADLHDAIDRQRALLAIVIPPDFSRNVVAGRPAQIEGVLDGRRSNAGQIALGYVQRVVADYSAGLGRIDPRPEALVVRNRFNPNLDYQWFILPTLVAIITTIGAMIVTALSLAREREQGTLDQLLVTPLTPWMIMTGKAVPAILIAGTQATMILIASIFLYRIPFSGSLLLFYGSMLFYVLALVGFGLFISTFCASQQQAFLGVFGFITPAILLSGYIAPIENMPQWLQPITWINPLRHFIVIVKGIYLKDLGPAGVWPSLWPLLLLAVVTLGSALVMFRRRTA